MGAHAPPFQCCVTIFILFQAPSVLAHNTTTLIGEGAGEGRNVREKLHKPANYAQTVGVPFSFETDCPKAYLTSSQCSGNFIFASSSKLRLICQFMSTCFICAFHGILYSRLSKTSRYSASHVTLLYASVKYMFISKIRSIGYFLVKCTGLLLDFTNLLCILNAFVHKSLV